MRYFASCQARWVVFSHEIGKFRSSKCRQTCCRRISFDPKSGVAEERYNEYRKFPPTHETLKRVKQETLQTAQCVDQSLYQKIYSEMKKTVQEHRHHTNNLPPESGPTGQYAYKWNTDTVSQARLYQRYLIHQPTKAPQTVLDMREIGMDAEIESMSLSNDESLMAYVVHHPRNSQKELWIRNISKGIQTRVPAEGFSVAQAEFGGMQEQASMQHRHLLLWTESCPQGRPFVVKGCLLDSGTPSSPIQTLYESQNLAVHVGIQRTKGGRYVVLNAQTLKQNEIHLISDLDQDPILVKTPDNCSLTFVEAGSHDDIFLIAPLPSTGELAIWQACVDQLPFDALFNSAPFLKASPGQAIFDVDLYQSFVVIYERSTQNGVERVRVVDRTVRGEEWIVPLPDTAASTLSPVGNLCYETRSITFALENPASMRRIFQYNVVSRCVEEKTTPNNCTSNRSSNNDIEQERLLVSSQDGALVPLTFVYKRNKSTKSDDSATDCARHVLLSAYGSYGTPLDLSFNPCLAPLLNRGIILAFAHVRGGGELGKKWEAQKSEKVHSIQDFIACAQAIKTYAVGASARVTAKGFSAGGVVIAGAINKRSDVFDSVILTNSFLDVESALQNADLHLSHQDWAEFGNPLDPMEATAVKSICPVASMAPSTNVASPRVLLIGTLDDEQVPFWHSLVYGEKLTTIARYPNVKMHFEATGGHHLQGTRERAATLELLHVLDKL